MVQVIYTLHGSIDVLSTDVVPGGRIAAALIDGALTFSKVNDAFPFEGEFHFRVKVPGADVGIVDTDFVWLDLTPQQDMMVQQQSSSSSSCSDVVEVQALALSLPQLSEEEAAQQQRQYLEEVRQVMPDERQRALPFVSCTAEAAAAVDADGGGGRGVTRSIGSGLSTMKRALRSKLKRIGGGADAGVDGPSAAAAAASGGGGGGAGLSAAAGGWWNAVRATAEKLSEHVAEAVGQIAEGRELRPAAAASPAAQENLLMLHSQLGMPYTGHSRA